jgi:uncharacterized protein
MHSEPTLAAMTAMSWSDLPGGERLVEGDAIILSRCPACELTRLYPFGVCPNCGSPTDRLAARGRGEIYSHTVIRRSRRPGFAELTPYAMALVDLEEGPRVLGIVMGDPAGISIGGSVDAHVVRGPDDRYVVIWSMG